MTPLVLAAHGSRDPRSPAVLGAIARAAGRRWAAPVLVGFLEFNEPSVRSALRRVGPFAGPGGPVVLPALLTNAYHGRVDLPEVLAGAGPHRLAGVLGPDQPGDEPDPRLLTALERRLSAVDVGPFDGLVLIAAGTSHAPARSTVEGVAAALARRVGVACAAGYASSSGRPVEEAVQRVRAAGASRIVAASYFLAPGRLYDAAAASARASGVLGVAEPLGAATELVSLVLARAAAALPPLPAPPLLAPPLPAPSPSRSAPHLRSRSARALLADQGHVHVN